MSLSDYPRMIGLWKRTPGIGLSDADSESNIERFLEHNPGLCFVSESDGRLIGTVLCGHDARRGYLYHLAVDERWRKQGIGGELAARSLEELQRLGIGRCHLFLYDDNSTAMTFYEKTGWRRRKNLLIYSKDLLP